MNKNLFDTKESNTITVQSPFLPLLRIITQTKYFRKQDVDEKKLIK